ncbi:MAG TPA: ABC transporter ATP-binding protein [Gemmatimonadaceae bacterium]|nr:ABC transporter ATP-binding protein [Gemmatimonadaceae bacterium]
MTAAIRLQGVDYRASKEFAIRDLALNVPRGAVYGFLGPNGSGKTTAIKLMLGMLEAEHGTIDVLGHDIPRSTHLALAKVGYVPERLHLWMHLTVEEAMRVHASFYATWDQARADALRNQFGLRPSQPIFALSKGEAGKLMMLLALATQPELLVLDEPTDGLDPVVRRDVLEALVEYVGDNQATVLISSHLVHEQERICDWVGVLDGGKLVAEMPMQEFRSGIKRIRVRGAPRAPDAAPFTLLSRDDQFGRGETWVVRGWQDAHAGWLSQSGASVSEVESLDLEESFVELLRSGRSAQTLKVPA